VRRSSLSPRSLTLSKVRLLFLLPRAKHASLCSSTVLRLYSASRHAVPLTGRCRLASVSRHLGPPPSCAQDHPQGRSHHRVVGHREAKVADVEFFVHRECLSSASLLWRLTGPAEPSTSFASPTCRSPTSPAPTSTLPPASHQCPPPLRSVVVARRRQRASRLPIPQIGTSSWASSPTPPCFTSSPVATGIAR
jgi:hypothetical protein